MQCILYVVERGVRGKKTKTLSLMPPPFFFLVLQMNNPRGSCPVLSCTHIFCLNFMHSFISYYILFVLFDILFGLLLFYVCIRLLLPVISHYRILDDCIDIMSCIPLPECGIGQKHLGLRY